jgi:phosphate butyryltransferase
VSQVIGNRLPGPGAEHRAQSFTFHKAVAVGDELVISVRVLEKREPRLIVLETRVALANGDLVADGVAEVFTPLTRRVYDHLDAPDMLVHRHASFDRLLAACEGLSPLSTAVVMPHDAPSLEGAFLAAQAGLIVPVLIGDAALMHSLAAGLGRSLAGIEVVAADTPARCASEACRLAHTGQVRALMKGSLHSDILMAGVLAHESGLRGERRVSHIFVMDTPGMDRPLFISDAAINIAPDLMAKADIVRNAIDLARACGLERPRVGILSAVETINPNIPSTLDAAILSKMAERGQISGGIVDGPLAMDNAIDIDAARTKGITSLVAGRADILIVPNLESGNMLAKELTFIAHAQAAGLVLGARVPVMLTSRADSARARQMSCALAVLHDHWQRTGQSAVVPRP